MNVGTSNFIHYLIQTIMSSFCCKLIEGDFITCAIMKLAYQVDH